MAHFIPVGIFTWGLVLTVTGTPVPLTSEVCYGELGCFSDEAPFNNTEGLLPQSPERIDTTFRLFTHYSGAIPLIIRVGDADTLLGSDFSPDLPVKVIVHGFMQHGQVPWITDMTKELQKKSLMNVITVDWGSGSGLPYSQAAANTRVAGAEVARMIQFLRNTTGILPGSFHLIGHSLGAHVMGYAGALNPGIRRISGLDPAQPAFGEYHNIVHLDATDANFVDIVHTDGSEFDYVSGFGLMEPLGHVDFYPNGGENQPGCPVESVGNFMSEAYHQGISDAEETLSCSHSRSIFLFTESINSVCPFFGHACHSYADLQSNTGNCLQCGGRDCPLMGYEADEMDARGKFYLSTRGSSPFCGYSQHVDVVFGNMSPTTGRVRVQLVGTDQTTDTVGIDSGAEMFRARQHREKLWVDRVPITDVMQVRVTFVRQSGTNWWWRSSNSAPHAVNIDTVAVSSVGTGIRTFFCGDHRTITNGNTVTLTRRVMNPRDCRIAILPN